MCYVIRSTITGRVYIGYTVDFNRRIRQHNGEIKGGAKKTQRGQPWEPICVIQGFIDNHTALRFEYKMQHGGKRPRGNFLQYYLWRLCCVIIKGDGLLGPWTPLTIYWFKPYYNNYFLSLHNVNHFNII